MTGGTLFQEKKGGMFAAVCKGRRSRLKKIDVRMSTGGQIFLANDEGMYYGMYECKYPHGPVFIRAYIRIYLYLYVGIHLQVDMGAIKDGALCF